MKSDSSLLLGVDAGGSGTKWHLRRGTVSVAAGRLGPLTALLLGTSAGHITLRELADLLPAQPQAIHIGLPGFQQGGERAGEFQRQWADVFGLEPRFVSVESDLDLAFHAHLELGQGALLYAGTGSIAYSLSLNGVVYRAGGRGYRLGDDGGGFSIGRAALRWVTDALDVGQVPAGALADELVKVTGGLDWNTLRTFVYGTPGAGAVAKLALPVAYAAAVGDAAALNILRGAAFSLAELARRIRVQAGDAAFPILATGGALQSSVLQEFLQEALPGVMVQFRPHEQEASRRAGRLLLLEF